MTISCLILDDEEISIRHLQKYVEKIPFLLLTTCFTDPVEAIRHLQTNTVDLIFLDVEMPNHPIDGMDFVKIMGETQKYIFTTAYPSYALPSYEYNAIDFLHKPFSFERFSKAVQKARLSIHTSVQELSSDSEECIYIRVEGRLQRICFTEICWIESDRNTISIFTDTEQFYSLLSISDIEIRLPANQFVRIHKSYIISISKAVVIDKEMVSIRRLNQLKEIPIGEAFRKDFIQSLDSKILRRR